MDNNPTTEPKGVQGASKRALGAGALAELAASLSAPARSQADAEKWSKSEGLAFCALARSAIRRSDMDALEAAIGAFGGLPPEGSEANVEEPLRMAASMGSAVGFERILDLRQAQRPSGPRSARDGGLGEWLRDGLLNSLWSDASSMTFRDLDRSSMCRPVAACLSQDNPVALAIVLCDPERLAALVQMEPAPSEDGYSVEELSRDWSSVWSMGELIKKSRSNRTSIEDGLFWNAVSAKAYRCAALLAAMPEFSAPLDKPAGFFPGMEHPNWAGRRPLGYDQRTELGIFQEAEKVEFCLFDWAMTAAISASDDGPSHALDHLAASGSALVESMVRHASSEAKAWRQEGIGVGWPEIYIGRACPQRWGDTTRSDNEFGHRAVARTMSMLSLFEESGFDVQWDVLADIFARSPALRDWAQIRSSAEPARKAPRQARSL